MKKILSLLKATMSQDMNIFRIKRNGKSKLSKIASPMILAGFVMFIVGTNAQIIAEILSPMGLTYILLSLFIVLVSVLTIIEGAYKSQGILFEAKDSELLFSLPITKTRIFFTRIFKMITFQFLYNLLFMLPAIIVYSMYEKPNYVFYIVSAIMLILSPIIPTIIGSFIGYIIKGISSRFKAKNAVQVILSCSTLLFAFYISFNQQGMLTNLTQNATNINDIITKIYYPAGLYINLIQNFNIIDLIVLFAISIVPAVIFIYLAGIFYFKLTSKSTEKSINKKFILKENTYNVKNPLRALIYKELKRFLSSPVFIINSAFGLLLIVVATIGMAVNFNGLINSFIESMELQISTNEIMAYIPKIYFCFVVFTSLMTSITSSMISLEGKNIDITKSLPVPSKKILLAKILTSNSISVPIILICDVVFFILCKVDIINIILTLSASIVVPTFSAILGLIINLKHPKLDASSDTEIVKQSMSSFIAVFSGVFIGMLMIGITVICGMKNIILLLEVLIFAILDLLLWQWIKNSGVKKFERLNV